MVFLQDYALLKQWNVMLFAFILGVGSLYGKLIKGSENEDILFKSVMFYLGLLFYFIVHGTPINVLSDDYLFSYKMVQESVSYFLVPLLLLVGLTPEMLRPILWHHKIRKGFLFSTHPLLGTLLFYSLFTLYHFPVVFSAIMSNSILDVIAEVALLSTAIMMWWPIVSPMRGFNQISTFQKSIYLFINSIMLVIPMLPVIFYDVPNLAYVGHTLLSPEQDFKIGATIIIFYQKFLIIFIAGAIFFKWINKEDKIDPVDVSVIMGARNLTKK